MTDKTPQTAPNVPDPALDVTSEKFDPLKALYASADQIKPVKNARIYDNIGKYESVLSAQKAGNATGSTTSAKQKAPSQPATSADSAVPSTSKGSVVTEAAFQRKFEPHQLMIQGSGPKARHKRNLLDRLANEQKKFEGPLAAVQKLMIAKHIVTVYTRNASRVDGYLIGRIEMFDKHWNLALVDVLEVRKRRKALQCDTANMQWRRPALAESESVEVDDDVDVDCRQRLRELRVRLPAVSVRSLNRKYVELTRSLPKAMVRGEQVVLVRAATGAEQSTREHTSR